MGKIIWGLVLVFIGTVLLLDNLGIVNFYWSVLWRFWPIFFILMGVNMIFGRSESIVGAILIILITTVTLIFIGYQGSHSGQGKYLGFRFNDFSEGATRSTDLLPSSSFSEPYIDNTRKVELNISGGATNYRLSGTTSNLFDADIQQNYGSYVLQKTSRELVEVLDFRMRGGNGRWDMHGKSGNEANICLNPKPMWNIHVEVGAGKINFDLTPFKIDTLTLKGGAAAFNVKLGVPKNMSTVQVEAGVARVAIQVPEVSLCRLYIDSGLSSRNFKGFTKQDDGSYISDHYVANNPHQINIHLKGGLAKFEVSRY